ncbi:MAG TPA: EAL domain-containing protein [Solirubrobacteraceae bacterium]|nr:EAL domain-containing protein [Solirubrobacteraceae bacterium]
MGAPSPQPVAAGAARRPGAGTAAVQVAALCCALTLAGLTAEQARWDPVRLAAIATFTLACEWATIEVGPKLRVSGSFLGIVLAVVTLGGAPASLLGVLTIAGGWLRSREAPHYLRNNLAVFAWFPLLCGLAFHAADAALGASPSDAGFYLLVFATFVLGLSLNFLGIAGYQCRLDRGSLLDKARSALVPLLSAELFSALLTVAAVYVTEQLGTAGLVLFALVFLIFQHLIGQLLESRRRGEALRRSAVTDELTGLANRERFMEAIGARIASAQGRGQRFSVLLMDLDRFKEVNDTLGHQHGDSLLRQLGPRLQGALGRGGVVARLGGDEFGLLPPQDSDDPAVLDVVVGRLFAMLAQPFRIDGLSLEVGASVGVARYPRDGSDAHALLRCADVAMYNAKESQTEYKLYEAATNQHSVRRLSVLSEMRHALATDAIVVHFQPIIDLEHQRVRGAEGLVRWQHPEHGLIPPAAFVHTVEQSGLIGPLTRHVLERSIAECAAWRRQGRELSVAVNLSVRNLLDSDLPRQIDRLLEAHELPPEALLLEITESMIMSDPDRALTTVGRLSALGVRLSVDDFGTGYSSLANLRRMPIDELKIDRSFVAPMLRDESDLIIVRSTINLGHDLGLNVIAEGVEDQATLQQLARLGCDLAQGYHVSRPMPAEAFNAWLRHSSRAEGAGAQATGCLSANGHPRGGVHGDGLPGDGLAGDGHPGHGLPGGGHPGQGLSSDGHPGNGHRGSEDSVAALPAAPVSATPAALARGAVDLARLAAVRERG